MLVERPTLEGHSDPSEEYTIQVTTPDPVREGVVDVLSLRGLVRAFKCALGHSHEDDFQRALAKVINVNGALAQAVEIEQRRRRLQSTGRHSGTDA